MAEAWGSASVMSVGEGADRRAVVTSADSRILFSEELMDEISQGGGAVVPGAVVRNGDLVSFGTEGEGLGRLTYRIVGHDEVRQWYHLRRVDPDVTSTEPGRFEVHRG